MTQNQARAAVLYDMATRLENLSAQLQTWGEYMLQGECEELALMVRQGGFRLAPELFKTAPVIQELYEAPEIPRTAPEPMPVDMKAIRALIVEGEPALNAMVQTEGGGQ